MSQSEYSLSVDGGDRSSEAKLNAFGLGFFSGLTLGVSDIAFGSLLTRNEVERARADRIAHDDLDTFGKILGFGVLLFGGWKLFRRLRHKDE